VTRWRPATHVVGAILLLASIKIALAASVELRAHEAYYWLYAQHPALGYFDHPGMIGWIVWLSTTLFGDSPLGVRMVPIAAGSLAAWLVFLAGRQLYDERTGRLAALLTALVPMMFTYGTLATPDAPLLLFSSATLWAMAHALTAGRLTWWLAAGAFLGGAMLSKYQAILLAVGLLAFLVLSRDQRGWLRKQEPWLAALVAIVVFSPTLIWNAQHGWQSLRFQAGRPVEEGIRLGWKHLVAFTGSQFVLVTPVVCAWAWTAAARVAAGWRSASWSDRLCLSLGLPILGLFGVLALFRPIHEDWTLPAYPAILTLGAAAVERDGRWVKRLHWATLAVLSVAYLALPVVAALVPGDQRAPWAQLAEAVRQRKPDFVIAHHYHHASQLAYQLRPLPAVDLTAVGRGGKSFPHWWEAHRLAAGRAVIVYAADAYPDGLEQARQRFERVEEPEPIVVRRWGGKPRHFLLVRAVGYRPLP
jgi:4-amino-4-deoxy-L-arabinose transferase-like glycosyltransferase